VTTRCEVVQLMMAAAIFVDLMVIKCLPTYHRAGTRGVPALTEAISPAPDGVPHQHPI